MWLGFVAYDFLRCHKGINYKEIAKIFFFFLFLIFLPPGMLTLLDTKTSAWIAVIFTYMVSE